MKKYVITDDGSDLTLIVGTDREIRTLYKNMAQKDSFVPCYIGEPRLRFGAMYAILIKDGRFYVVNADTVVQLFIEYL